MENEIENLNSPNEETINEEVVDTSVEESFETEETDTVAKEEYEKLKREKDELYIQLKKAKAAKVAQTTQAGSQKGFDEDMYALLEAKVPKEDISEVREYAQLKNISVSEALKSSIVKNILREKEEQRNVASASNIGTSKRGSGKISDEMLLENAKRGKLPENDADILRLAGLKG